MQINNSNNKLKAVLLCGGKGERLYPLTDKTPKPLVKINDKPILSYIIDHLEKYNIMDLIVLTGYKSNKIESYLREANRKPNIQIIDSGEVDIIKRIQDALHFIDDDFMLLYRNMVMYGKLDILCLG